MGLKNIAHRILDIILPPRCVVTGEIVDMPGMLSPASWADLQFIDAPFCTCCGAPFDFTTESDMMCGACLDTPPEFTAVRAALLYNDVSRRLILAFKHGDRLQLTGNFSHWMLRTGEDILNKSDIIIPVPLHRKRLWFRRYNQSAVLARALAKHMPHIDYAPHILRRVKHTTSQQGLTKKERAENLKNATCVDKDSLARVKGKNICVIDDVYTSGATLNECARTLKEAGAKNVYALALARVLL